MSTNFVSLFHVLYKRLEIQEFIIFNADQLYAGRVQVMMEFVCCHAKASSDKP